MITRYAREAEIAIEKINKSDTYGFINTYMSSLMSSLIGSQEVHEEEAKNRFVQHQINRMETSLAAAVRALETSDVPADLVSNIATSIQKENGLGSHITHYIPTSEKLLEKQ